MGLDIMDINLLIREYNDEDEYDGRKRRGYDDHDGDSSKMPRLGVYHPLAIILPSFSLSLFDLL